MTTVEQINNSGVFAIEKSTGIKVEFKQVENFTDDDSITKKTFSIAELSELRSKLILITKGAQGKQIVDRFVSILDLCENLHCNLMKLIQSGCHLFANWKATVYCEKERKVSMLVNYGYSSSGLIHGGSNVESELRQTVAFLKVIHNLLLFFKTMFNCLPLFTFLFRGLTTLGKISWRH